MKVAYVTTYDARSLKGSNEWSGIGYYIAQSLEKQILSLEYIEPLSELACLKNRSSQTDESMVKTVGKATALFKEMRLKCFRKSA